MRSFETPGNSKGAQPSGQRRRRIVPRYGLREPNEWDDIRAQAAVSRQSATVQEDATPKKKVAPETPVVPVRGMEKPQPKRQPTAVQQNFFDQLGDRRTIAQINNTKTKMPKFEEPQVPQAPQEKMPQAPKAGIEPSDLPDPEGDFESASLAYREALEEFGPDDPRTLDAKDAWEASGKKRPGPSAAEIAADEDYDRDHPEEAGSDEDENDIEFDRELREVETKVAKRIEKDKGGL